MATKKEYKFFTIYEHKKEEEYLRQMHKSGWKFLNVTGLGSYHFVDCEPEDVIYRLDYNTEAIADKEQYIKMFKDCGWEYLQDFFGFSYFCKKASEAEGEEEIFSDEISRDAMMERVFKGRMLPLLPLFLVLLFWFFRFAQQGHSGAAAFYAVLLLVYVGVFAYTGLVYHRMKK